MSESHAVAVSTVKDVTIAKITAVSILDSLQIERIGADLADLADNPLIPKIIVDLAVATHLSSAALGMLLTVRKKCQATNSEMIISGLHPSLYKIFKLSKLDKLFTFAKDRKEALEAFGARSAD